MPNYRSMEIHPIDSGVISCVCSLQHDDGFTLQCEQCNAWQHGVCVGISTEDEAPEIFLCNKCGKLELDHSKAREKQLQYLRKRNRRRTTEDFNKKRRKDPEVADHPECFYNPIDECELQAPAVKIERLRQVVVPDFDVSAKRVSSVFGPTAFGLETNIDILKGEFAAQINGQVDWLSNYKKNPFNQYQLLGCPKPGVLFIDGFVVDSRRRGNEGAFVQHSSTPNCRVGAFKDPEGTLKILLIAAEDIKAGALLTVPWTWDPKHPIHKPLASLIPAESAIIERSLNRLREFGLQGPIRDFLPLPSDRIEVPILALRKSKPRKPEKETLPQPKPEFTWTVPVVVPVSEELPKKRLSLADYKKKRPSVH